ncbi:MAG TPA: MarR family winged helix-turn-helix transcriptional regulator [Streptosporangiaceae bacterium]
MEQEGLQKGLADTAADIRRGAMRLARRLRAERPAGALSGNKISILARLHQGGPATPGELAAAERQRPQSLTRAFAEMERAGLVVRSPSQVDRRQSVLAITPAGVDELVRDMAHRDAWLISALAGLTDTERQVLRIAGTLMDRLATAP